MTRHKHNAAYLLCPRLPGLYRQPPPLALAKTICIENRGDRAVLSQRKRRNAKVHATGVLGNVSTFHDADLFPRTMNAEHVGILAVQHFILDC